MDQNALNQLIAAKRLLSLAAQQSRTGDRFAASVGIVTLQDALELVLIACLKGKKPGKTFNELLQGIESDGHQIAHKSSLLALNDFRVAIKHHGGLVDQQTLKECLNNSTEAIHNLVLSVFGKPYHQIYSAELIQDPESRAFLEKASKILEMDLFNSYECLANIRKAIFINFEERYSVEEWGKYNPLLSLFSLETLAFKHEAPFHTRDKEWIETNVSNPFDYIQISYSQLARNLMEYGISPAIFFSLCRLTPKVFRFKGKVDWKTEGKFVFMRISKETVNYCLSATVEMILLKENYDALHISPPKEIKMQIKVTQPTFLYKKSSINSEKLKQIEEGEIFFTNSFVPSFDDDSSFIAISEFRKEPNEEWLRGYILADHVDLCDDQEKTASNSENSFSPSN